MSEEDRHFEMQITRWQRSQEAGLPIEEHVRPIDLTPDLLVMGNTAAWKKIIDRAQATPSYVRTGLAQYGRGAGSSEHRKATSPDPAEESVKVNAARSLDVSS
jgi:hypothetical protein